MKRIECYQADNGSLETDLIRAKAHDLASAVEKAVKAKDVGPISTGAKIDWHAAMEILRHADLVKMHIDEYLENRT
ncbi:hypothetical protein EVC02_004 [Rhizobium phage RHph_N17]|nr:hypothetical protein EVC02_004 [Rhizobium phage RHph_N17]